MTRYGAQFGPDLTFLGVPAVDLTRSEDWADADVVVIGAPFDGGTSHRPGTRFGPMAIRQTCYRPHDGSRPHLALRVDALQDVRVVDAGDVEMPPGEIERALGALEDAVHTVAAAGKVPLVLGLSARQLLDAVRRICLELPVAGIDVVEVSPPYDHAEITAHLANRVCLEALSGLAARRKGLSHDPAGPLLDGR